jgi:hypothetical protein
MEESKNHILQLTDLVTTRRCALRVDPRDSRLPLESLLDRYLKHPPLERMLRERWITEESAETLASIQDMVYVSDDEGRLRNMFAGVAFKQGARALVLDDVPRAERVLLGDKPAVLTDVAIDRTSVGYDRNWVGFNKRRWQRQADAYSAFVLSCLEEKCGRREAEAVLDLASTEHKLRLVEVLARKIWESDFESYSRFVGRRLVYKSGDETVRNIIEGSGGICSEKVQALKFLTDHYGLESELVLAGADVPRPVPEARLRELLTTFDFSFSKRHMRYWQHTALLYTIDGAVVLVDATNGNIPFLFMRDTAAHRLLGYDSKPSIKVKMAVSEEAFYYHRVSQDIGENLFFAMEGWIPYVDLVQVFDNELGLYISKDFMVTPIVYGNGNTYDRVRQQYLTACERAGLRCDVADEWDLESPLGQRFALQEPLATRKVLDAKDHLLARYDDCHGSGHQAGLVVIELRP